MAGKIVKAVDGFSDKPAQDESREGVGENERAEEVEDVEEYLQTANWQLGNRRVRCCLMSDTRREEEREERSRDTFT